MGDRVQLQQVMMNLMNSIDAMNDVAESRVSLCASAR
jgi:C4-dicarboxylate-specific signal transduction histidine kinase